MLSIEAIHFKDRKCIVYEIAHEPCIILDPKRIWMPKLGPDFLLHVVEIFKSKNIKLLIVEYIDKFKRN